MNKKVLYVTQTGVIIAVLIAAQFITRPLGQLFTGSTVNLILFATVFTIGIPSALTVAVISPILATFFGIGMLPLSPAIAISNALLVLTAYYLTKLISKDFKLPAMAAGVYAAAVVKFASLWVLATQLIIPIIPDLPEKKAAVLAASFSWMQLATASIGGTIALIAIPLIKRAIKKS